MEIDELAARFASQLGQLTPRGFEELVAAIFRLSGYRDVKRIGGAGDLAVDITCRSSDGQRVAVQCKQYGAGRTVGSPEIQLFIGMTYTHHTVDQRFYVTSGSFTRPAIDLARQHKIELIDGGGLARMLAERVPDLLPQSEQEELAETERLVAAGVLNADVLPQTPVQATDTYHVQIGVSDTAEARPTATASELLPRFSNLPRDRAILAASVTAQGPTKDCDACAAPMQLMFNPPTWFCWNCNRTDIAT